ncbi:MAG: hypothetical protein ACYTEE_10000 [Planctomycetota bacterium]
MRIIIFGLIRELMILILLTVPALMVLKLLVELLTVIRQTC